MLKFLTETFDMIILSPYLKDGVRVLDVGCGQESPYKYQKFFPKVMYFGLDIKTPPVDPARSFVVDLDHAGQLSVIPDDSFDVVIMSHVIEHCEKPVQTVQLILGKLKASGVLYIETPSAQSSHLPKMKPPFLCGTLNFYDDPSHRSVCSLKDIVAALGPGVTVLKTGIRRDVKRIILMPCYIAYSLIKWGRVNGGCFWDVMGFSEFTLLRMNGASVIRS